MAQDKDKESLFNTSILHCGEDYAGLVPLSVSKLATKHRMNLPTSSLLPTAKQQPVRNILREYEACLCQALVTMHKDLGGLERANRRLLLTRGEVSDERQERVEKLRLEYGKLTASAEQMADLVEEEMEKSHR